MSEKSGLPSTVRGNARPCVAVAPACWPAPTIATCEAKAITVETATVVTNDHLNRVVIERDDVIVRGRHTDSTDCTPLDSMSATVCEQRGPGGFTAQPALWLAVTLRRYMPPATAFPRQRCLKRGPKPQLQHPRLIGDTRVLYRLSVIRAAFLRRIGSVVRVVEHVKPLQDPVNSAAAE